MFAGLPFLVIHPFRWESTHHLFDDACLALHERGKATSYKCVRVLLLRLLNNERITNLWRVMGILQPQPLDISTP